MLSKPHKPKSEDDLFIDSSLPMHSGIKRLFLGWEKPLVQSVTEHLASGWDGKGALDLSDWLIVVPTRHASRRLREALAVFAATKDAAVLPPLTVTPDFLTSPDRLLEVNAAGQVETLLLWTAEMLRLDLETHRHVFPIDPVERTFTWALKTAADLLQVRETLNENGLSLRDAANLLEKSEMEPERWRDLAKLEQLCLEATQAHGLTDWQVVRRLAATEGLLPSTVRRIMIVGVLDPSALAIQALDRHSRQVPVEVLVFAPAASHSSYFDLWGRPLAKSWLTEPIQIDRPDFTIHQGSTPAAQASEAIALIAVHPLPGKVAAIGVADVEIAAPLEKALVEHGIGAYDPAGKSMGTHGVFHLLRLLSQLSASRAFGSAAQLLRCPDIAETVRQKTIDQTGVRPSLTRLLNDLDDLSVAALPDTLDDAIELAPRTLDDNVVSPIIIGLAWLDATLKNLSGPNFGSALTDFLAEVFSLRSFRLDRPKDAVFAAIADQIAQVLDALEGPSAELFQTPLSAGSRLELLLRVMDDQVFYPERAAHDIDIQGWLELLWEDAPHLVIAGMNDGKVPESILSHQFLPDSARRALGLRNNDTRFTRDACLMTSIIELRKRTGGRVDFIFGRIGSGEEPLRPSRLLFQCPDADLAERTLQFFKKPETHVEPMPWQLAWQLRPQPLADDAPIFRKLSVTQFRDYLTCPFRFYLKHGLKMRAADASGTEMDAMSFGSLLHHVLEKFATESPAATSTDVNIIRSEFHRLLEAKLHATFGQRLTVPVMIQCESARQRLSWWAETEAEERAKGWHIVAAETRISPEGNPWQIGPMIVSGIVDRVERHPQLGIRLIDFKTYSPSTAQKGERKGVEDYHLTKLKRTEDPALLAPWSLTTSSQGHAVRWSDLQLPLYHLAMQQRYPNEKIHTAYATLGKTKGDVGIDAWPDLEGHQLESAKACAEGIISAVLSRHFWPPAEKVPFADDFDPLFFGDPLKAVDASLISNLEVASNR
jgi:ATP-dependent helicase/nuclease subunit B